MGGSRGFAAQAALSTIVLLATAGLITISTGSDDSSGNVSGTISLGSGTVSYSGSPPAPVAIDMSADAYCADQHQSPVMNSSVRLGAAGGVAGVLVYVANASAGSGPAAEAGLLDQIGCMYTPGALVARPGETIVIRNSDRTLHNVRVSPELNDGFNLGQPLAGIESRRSFDEAEIGIPVRCDVHGWMTATIHVVDHGFHALSGADGEFRLPDLPAGEWTIEAWHPTLGVVSRTVTVEAGADVVIDLEFSDG